MKCPTCGNDNPGDAQFCGVCGASLSASTASNIGAVSSEVPMVSFIDAIQLGFRNYFRFSGRSTRAEYWWWTLFVPVAQIILAVVGTFIGDSGLLVPLFGLATLVPGLALGARRLHDINRSALWLLGLLGFFPLVLPGLVMFVLLLIWACKQGDEGQNQYGPDPRQDILDRTIGF